jgi:hypothetical protein
VTGRACADRRSGSIGAIVPGAVLSLGIVACSSTLDAGRDKLRGLVPVDNRSPVVLCNDGPKDNWQGEYAIQFASAGELSLAGIVISDSPFWSNLDDNMAGWKRMVAAARESGIRNLPEPLRSTGPVLVRPSDETIDSTAPNHSEGAQFIVDASKRLSSPSRPLAVVNGGRLTDLADAYLIDHTVPERVVVVAALGTASTDGAEMGIPNGELDTWADIIVAQKFRYVQVNAYYRQADDVTDNLASRLPANAFTSWIQSKKDTVYADDPLTSDQVAVLAVAIPSYVSAVVRVAQRGTTATDYPALQNDADGPVWLVTKADSGLGTARFQEILLDRAASGSE